MIKEKLIGMMYYLILIIYFILFVLTMNGINVYFIYISFLLTLVAILCIAIGFIKYNKELKEVQEYNYYRELKFKHVNATISGVLLKKTNVNINTILTAIYELSEKNILDIQWKENKNYITLKSHNKEEIKKLLPYQRKIVYYIFNDIDDNETYCLEEILKETKENAKKAYIIEDIEKDIKIFIKEKYYTNYLEYLKKESKMIYMGSSLYIPVFIFGGIYLIISLLTKENIVNSTVHFISVILSMMMFIYTLKGNFIKNTYFEEVKKLKGLYNYMSDYTLLKQEESKFYQLYDEYYVYAIGLGLADKFEKELGQVELNNKARKAIQFYFQNKEDIECS